MVLLQHKLSVKLSQRQILTPGLVQMVSVLALNKLELKDMINAEMVENPVLEELEDSVPLLDEVGKKEEDRERAAAANHRRKSHHRGREERSVRRNRFRLVFPGLSRSRLPHAQRDGRDRAAVVREFSLQADESHRPPAWQLGALEPALGSARSRRPDHRQSERRRIPDRQRRRVAGDCSTGSAGSRRRSRPRTSSAKRKLLV